MTALVPALPTTPTIPVQADPDAQVIALWLHGRGSNTEGAYTRDIARFLAFVRKPIPEVTLRDVQEFTDSLTGAVSTRRRIISALKSLFSFALKIGYVRFSVAAAVRAPKEMDTLAERILPEPKIHEMIALTPEGRDRMLLRVLYATGARVSEICAIKWRHVQANGDSGQITVFSKGGKTHAVLLPQSLWKDLVAFRHDADEDAPVFLSRKRRGHLTRSQVLRIVQQAARRAGIRKKVSPHWFRHAHASHAIDRGAGIHLVCATLAHSSIAVTGRYLHAKPSESSAKFLAV
ncbi:MAG TPA: tyrosine-type recombinase/integrase [Bryobacteraceae bacterium]|nr:tyrosine-type recombinase/integrase [Bryobacteraceae bacterium]